MRRVCNLLYFFLLLLPSLAWGQGTVMYKDKAQTVTAQHTFTAGPIFTTTAPHFSAGLSALANPSIAYTSIIGNAGKAAVLSQGTTIAGIGQSQAAFELTSTTSDNAVALAATIVASPGSGATWAFNPVAIVNPGAGSPLQTIEVDLANLDADRGNTAGLAGLGGASSIGISIAAAGHLNTAAISISGTDFNRGIVVWSSTTQVDFASYGSSPKAFSSEGNPTRAVSITGLPTYGIYQDYIGANNYFNGQVTLGITTGSAGRALTVDDYTNGFEQMALSEGGVDKVFLGSNTGSSILFRIFDAGTSAVPLSISTTDQVSMVALKTTGAATGKKVVCVDTATGQLYASTSDTQCLN